MCNPENTARPLRDLVVAVRKSAKDGRQFRASETTIHNALLAGLVVRHPDTDAVDQHGRSYALTIDGIELADWEERRLAKAREKRNARARDRSQAMRDLGLKRAPGGAFGGWD